MCSSTKPPERGGNLQLYFTSALRDKPEEIRKKLAARSANAASGPSRFQSKDLPSEPALQDTKAKAQSPEELRKKLASRKDSGSPGGRAVFQSKDLSDDPNKPR